MGTTNTSIYTEEPNVVVLSKIFQLLSSPARISILMLLKTRTQANVSEIMAEIPLKQATISQHLKQLKRFGMISASPIGQAVYYRLHDGISALKNVLTMFPDEI